MLAFGDASAVLWVGAHPDDELVVAPLLEALCRRGGKSCELLVLTNGGKGRCLLPSGCLPDIVTTRRAELEASAAYFDAGLTRWELEDSPAGSVAGVLTAWNASDGGVDLVTKMSEALGKLPPGALVLTFDPRHGSTCHADHRTAATIAVLAAQRIGFPLSNVVMSEVRFVEGREPDGTHWAGWTTAVPADATQQLFAAGANWRGVGAVLVRHPSQFSPDVRATFDVAPGPLRVQPVLRASNALQNDARYELCP